MLAQDAFANLILTLPGDLPRQVMNELSRGWKVREVMAAKEAQQIAQQREAEGPSLMVDGIGQHTMSVPEDAFHYWGHKLGYGCWRNKKFRREYVRDNPEVRVKSVARTTTIIRP